MCPASAAGIIVRKEHHPSENQERKNDCRRYHGKILARIPASGHHQVRSRAVTKMQIAKEAVKRRFKNQEFYEWSIIFVLEEMQAKARSMRVIRVCRGCRPSCFGFLPDKRTRSFARVVSKRISVLRILSTKKHLAGTRTNKGT